MRDEIKSSLTPKQKRAVAALLSEPTHERAAETAGVSAATLYRWKASEPFMEAYREASRRAFEEAIRKLHAMSGRAVKVLEDYLESDDDPGRKARIVFGILDRSFKGLEVLDVQERLERLEQLLDSGASEAGRLG